VLDPMDFVKELQSVLRLPLQIQDPTVAQPIDQLMVKLRVQPQDPLKPQILVQTLAQQQKEELW
jgi:hypothetical protein